MDDNCETFAEANRQVQDALGCYREIYKGMKSVQTNLDTFLKRPTPGSLAVVTALPSSSYH
ncbi:hypothetical protein M514_06324 [Trichuris suis]|uniref:Uncharacterized protein n=1 Tax=Trichuris suis TaxID=68888 RepID=A0A085N628_9BILA|nr:hypothetical protein M513_06324 [Trichuris suis]KFD64924.1 hypothetical protein M514_06324 [Trichuris suis]